MRLLWSLPKAAPAILRHLVAYAELAGQDLEQSTRDLGLRLVALLVLGVAGVFAILFGCLVIVAMTWDTPSRVPAIGGITAFFVVLALFCGLYRSRVIGAQTPFLGSVRREWAEDRIILEKILSDHPE